ncbi:cell wall protein [Streptomyces sp. OF3]|uniref:Cell wall protein n=1 Tax=Streptomyces alkaliterrae TaxID=2213162 RepID=A0A7W3ZN64_9ACTN|nr:cell wall protein [Streptomyces alkaliterrae]MBB1254634.1 cell wall protein [Streptomyces alkaliterrae]
MSAGVMPKPKPKPATVPGPRPAPESGSGHRELEFELVRGRPAQEVARTRSRRAQPRAWLRAVTWLVAAGLHPKAGEATLSVARDLAARMDYLEGLVLYDLEGTARRLKVSRATVKRHVAILRELGALVWLRHGSKRNLHLPGRKYAGTATIYGAVIPSVFDEAMGHRLSGDGYQARIVGVTEAGRERAVAAARRAAKAVDNSSGKPVDNRRPAGREPHSRGGSRELRKVEVSGGLKDTSRKRASRSTASTSPSKTSSSGAERRRSPLQVARDIVIARQVRPLVSWTQHEQLRRLAFALRPLIDQGQDAQTIAAELSSWQYAGGPGVTWRPAKPAAYITAQLNRRTEREQAESGFVTAQESPALQAHFEQLRAAQALRQMIEEANAPARTDEDRRQARYAAQYDPQRVLDHLVECGEGDAFDLYGWRLVSWAQRLADSPHLRQRRW